MRANKIRFIFGVIVISLFISSCSSNDELASREKFLQSAIENKVENCDSLYALYSFTSYADISVYSLSEESQIANANLFKKYALEVLAVSKLNNHFNKTEYLKELESVIQEIDKTDLPDNKLEGIGKRYFPDCGYFQNSAVPTEPQKEDLKPQGSKQQAISFSGLGSTTGTEMRYFKGSYKVNWETQGNCYYSGDLKGGDLASFDFINAFNVQDSAKGTTYLYDMGAGEYFLKVTTGPTPNCPWNVTFIPAD